MVQRILIDENTWGMSIGESTRCRKIISKKKIKEIPKFHQLVIDKGHERGLSDNFIKYIWEQVITPQLG